MQNNNKKIIGLVFKCIIRALFRYHALLQPRRDRCSQPLLLLPRKGLIFYKVFNTGSSRSFAFCCFSSALLWLQQVPCDKAKQPNDSSPGGASFFFSFVFAYDTWLSFFFPPTGLHFPCDFCPFSSGKCNQKVLPCSGGCCPLLLLTILTRRGSRRLIVFVQMNWNLSNSTLTLSSFIKSCKDFINLTNNIAPRGSYI